VPKDHIVNVCQFFPYEVARGPANMALDEVLLETVASGASGALLRTYGWSVPTLSLGYFQRLAEARAESRWRDVPIVRRPTGGGAIWHHHEVTYALAVPESHPLARPSSALYRAVHAAIAGGLVGLGVSAVRQGKVFRSVDCERSRPLLCFTDLSPEDIVFEGVKIVGSAQRRRGGAVLQHGSIMLARSPQVPELSGLCDVADLSVQPKEWSDRLFEWIPKSLGLHPVAVQLPDEIRMQARERALRRYGDSAWTGIR
jgi:lipoyl(octanoyl) transferase